MICFMMVFLLRERERALNRSFWLLSGCFIQSEAFPSSTSIYGCKAGKTCSIVAFGIPLCFQYFTLTNDRWKFHWQAATSMCVCVFFFYYYSFLAKAFPFPFLYVYVWIFLKLHRRVGEKCHLYLDQHITFNCSNNN
jgi:hypothetical protein